MDRETTSTSQQVPQWDPKNPNALKTGRYALFVNQLRDEFSGLSYFLLFEPDEIIGHTVYIYELDAEDIARAIEVQKDSSSPRK